VFGISKQAYYKRIKTAKQKEMQAEQIKKIIEPIRKKMPRYGTKKLHLDIKDDLKNLSIKMGRDAFFTFARHHRFLVSKTKRCFITTDSKHFFYKSPNLIKNLVPTHSEQVFVNDITYIKLQDGYVYAALVTDLYSKKVMGYKMDDNMKVTLVKDALTMAINNCEHNRQSIIHHSDRGIQYCCPDYSEFAENKGMILSTTEKYDPYENAVAERINGILKYEFGLIKTIPSIDIANKMLKQAVKIYNSERRHCSLDMQTPVFAHTHQQHTYKSYKKQKPNSVQKMNNSTEALSTNAERKSFTN
jgi:transposase InsO family protein